MHATFAWPLAGLAGPFLEAADDKVLLSFQQVRLGWPPVGLQGQGIHASPKVEGAVVRDRE
jgi:hypothetical protein